MRVRRSRFGRIVAGAAGTALLLGGLAYTTLGTSTGPGCGATEAGIVPVLAAQKILTTHPDGAVVRDRHAGCFADDPFPYAGRSYEFPGTREEYTSFYDTAARTDGWRPVVGDESSQDVCYTKRIGETTAFLSLGGHSMDGVPGYGIDISASSGETPENGGLLC
ncbi:MULTISPECIES: hypothetical protein [unclassified Nonomuraea]|uniref:hypothetical protein n=1 Tax=unclassified Nonomuraea TaxID=2593643 RepID=UPI0033F9648E